MRVLIVEDDWGNLTGLAEIVRAFEPSSTVLTALNGADGLQLSACEPVDLLFLDIQMPILHGLGMLEELRTRYPDLCVVIASAYGTFSYAQRAIRLGVFDFILKPYARDNIVSILTYVASRRAGPAARRDTAQTAYQQSILSRWLHLLQQFSSSISYQPQRGNPHPVHGLPERTPG